eukprot:3477842-Rhodomonas_salina.4
MLLRACYALPGTEITYAGTPLPLATRRPVLTTTCGLREDRTPPPVDSVLSHTGGGLISEHHGTQTETTQRRKYGGQSRTSQVCYAMCGQRDVFVLRTDPNVMSRKP